jgi:coproporphyrinogen III oxidase
MRLVTDLFDRAAKYFSELQAEVCRVLAEVDGGGKQFSSDAWQRPGGGGGVARVLEGGLVFEKAGVNWSSVDGELPTDLADNMPGAGRAFQASGISLVLHLRSPMVPTTHANFRCLRKATRCGSAVAPTSRRTTCSATTVCISTARSPRRVIAIARSATTTASSGAAVLLPPHRGETRGIGGIFFDYLGGSGSASRRRVRTRARPRGDLTPPVVQRRSQETVHQLERTWQLLRRGRYVEFNLLYDRGRCSGSDGGASVDLVRSRRWSLGLRRDAARLARGRARRAPRRLPGSSDRVGLGLRPRWLPGSRSRVDVDACSFFV